MKAMIDAVIVGAKKVDAWDPQPGTWEVGMALRLYESVTLYSNTQQLLAIQ